MGIDIFGAEDIMNEQSERDLYALGMEDFNQQQDALAAFMTD